MSTWKVVLLTLLVTLVVVTATAWALLASEGLNARKKPSNFEYGIANFALALSIPSDMKKLANPVPVTAENLAEATKHYKEHCAVCHADDGSGQTETAWGMSPEVPDLHAGHVQRLTDGELFYVIKNGVRFTGMPAWKLPDDLIWRMVGLMRKLPEKK